jgi:hypothetical protein
MVKITGLKASPLQDFSVNDPNGGGQIAITLYYRPRVQSWFMDIAFKTFIMNGYKLTGGPNILESYHNVVPFGFGVAVSDGLDPFLVDDFTSGRVSLYLLTSAEVVELQALIVAGTVTG